MPKRSNDFQRLVHLVFEHLATSAHVQESALVMEIGLPTPTEREVDILVENEVAGVPWRMAVECRDRSRKDEIGWIDSLIGKFSHLPIDKVVAVSKSGLTRAAVEKAAIHRIEVRVLQDALEVDWQQEFTKLASGALAIKVSLLKFAVVSTPELPENFDPHLFTCIQDGVNVGSLSDVVKFHANQEAGRFFRKEFGKTYKTVADLRKIVRIQTEPRPKQEVLLQSSEANSYRLDQLIVLFDVRTELRKGQVDYFKFGQAGVSVGKVKLRGKEFKVTTVQTAGETKARIQIEGDEKLRQATPQSPKRKPRKHSPKP